jgi:AcrR family transcriptional regulator
VDEAIVEAVGALLDEVGYARLTMDAVAARAGIGKAAIYRRYSSKQEMVFASAVHGRDLSVPADTGSLHGDLTALAEVIVTHLSNPRAGSLLGMLGDTGGDPEAFARFTEQLIEPERAGNAEILQRAVHRGELTHLPDIKLFHAMFGGTVLYWTFIAREDSTGLPARLAALACQALATHQPANNAG